MDPKDYNGIEWQRLLKEMTPRQLRNSLKAGMRRTAKKVKDRAVQSLQANGPKHVKGNRRDWTRGIRTYVYSRGGGFLVSTKPHKAKGFHRNRQGLDKPVLMWAEDGTQQRSRKRKFYHSKPGTGRMPRYGFLEKAEPSFPGIIEADLDKDVAAAVVKAARKAGFY